MLPTDADAELFPYYHPGLPMTVQDSQARVKAKKGAEVLATLTLPYTDPTGTQFASMLTDPPGIHTDSPSIVRNRFGKGTVIYSTGMIESWEHDRLRQIVVNLVRSLAARPFWFETNGPKAVELTLFLQENRNRFILNVLNCQQELPNLPIYDLELRVHLDKRNARAVTILPSRQALKFAQTNDFVEFRLVELKDYAMVEVLFG
jgi:hypothetical protein